VSNSGPLSERSTPTQNFPGVIFKSEHPPATTPAPRLHRRDDFDDPYEASLTPTTGACTDFNYTIIQGPQTWSYQVTNAPPSTASHDTSIATMECSWEGSSATAILNCQMQSTILRAASGSPDHVGAHQEDASWKDLSTEGFVQAVTAYGVAVSRTTVTPTEPTNTAETTSSSRNGAMLGKGPVPTGAAALVGGAAGFYAYAMGL
jgi:hypothetical protein